MNTREENKSSGHKGAVGIRQRGKKVGGEGVKEATTTDFSSVPKLKSPQKILLYLLRF